MIKLIELATGVTIPSEEEMKERLKLISDINELVIDTDTDFGELYKHFKVNSLNELTLSKLDECKKILLKKLEKKESDK